MRTIRDEQPGGLLRTHARAVLQDAAMMDNLTPSEADDLVERITNHGCIEITADDVVRLENKRGRRAQWANQ